MAGRTTLMSIVLGVGVLVMALLSPVAAQDGSGGHSAEPTPGAPTTDLFVNGQEAVDRLDGPAERAPRQDGLTDAELAELLLADPTLFAAPDGELVYLDPMAPGEEPNFQPESLNSPVAAPPTNGPEFQLASLPGAGKSLYLDV